MKTSKSLSSVRKSASGRATTASSARSGSKPAAKKPAAKPSPNKPAAEPSVKKAVAKVKKAVNAVAKKVAPPKDDQARVHDLLADFSTVMFITSEGEKSAVHARPMSIAKLDDDCTLTFLTSVDSAKVHEARKDPVGHVVAQSKAVFLSIRGSLEVVRDRNRIHDVWSPADKVYFPKGKDDPAICLVVMHPEKAEIWDVSGVKGIAYLFAAARALLSGERPSHGGAGDTHDVIELNAAAVAAKSAQA